MNEEPVVTPDPLPAPAAPRVAGPKWFRRLSAVLFVVFCFELGLFLLIYPWTDAWADNYFSVAVPDSALATWRTLWNNPYVRGAVSGLGLVNVWIAIAEVFRMFARRGGTAGGA
jgi:hypothetical protein